MAIYMWRDVPYTYNYDFRNKSSTTLTNDGWTVASWLTFDSNWVTSSSWGNTTIPIWIDITNAKKIILTAWLYNANSTNVVFALWNTSSTYANKTWAYTDGYTSGNSSIDVNWTTVQSFTMAEPSWQSERTYTLDFENLTYNWEYNWTTKSWTMTQTQADGIRNNNTVLRFAIQYTWGKLQYISFYME